MEKHYSVTMVANATHTAEFTTKSTTDNFKPDGFAGEGSCKILQSHDRLLMTTSSGIPDLEQLAGKVTHVGYLYRLFKSIDIRNCVMIEDKGFGRRAAASEEELMAVIGCKLTTWKTLKRQLKKYHVLVKQQSTEIVDNGERPVRYFVNPLYTMRRSYWIPLSLYELYQKDLDPFLPPQVVDAFHAELVKAGRARIPERKPIKVDINIVPERIIPEKTEEEHFECFCRTVLRDNPQLFVAPYFNKMYNMSSLPLDDANPKSLENIFYLCQTSGSNSRKKDDITAYKNVCVDIDLGKKADKSYYSLEEVEERKEDIFKRIRPFIPTPSCVTWTRNGFHLIWSIEESSDPAGWSYIANQVNKIFSGLNDPSVTCDSARVLRMPYSTHHKEGTDAYYVTIYESNDIIYDIGELINQFENLQPILISLKDEILEKYPEIKQQQSTKSCTANAKSCTMNAAELNEYHQKLAALDTSAFDLPDEPAEKMTKNQAKNFLREEVDLAEFLQLPDNRSFDCIFHQTEGGDGNSANIYAPDKEYSHWRYVCHCLDAEDIFGCMYRLSHRSFDDIFAYLCKVANIEIVD